MKGRLFFTVCGAVCLLCIAACAFAFFGRERPSALPADPTGHDLAVSPAMALRALSVLGLSERGITLSGLQFSPAARVRAEGSLSRDHFADQLGRLGGALSLLPEHIPFGFTFELAAESDTLVLLPVSLSLLGLTLSAERLPQALVSALSQAARLPLDAVGGIRKVGCSGGMLLVWLK